MRSEPVGAYREGSQPAKDKEKPLTYFQQDAARAIAPDVDAGAGGKIEITGWSTGVGAVGSFTS